jgi:hypothetical protein
MFDGDIDIDVLRTGPGDELLGKSSGIRRERRLSTTANKYRQVTLA